MKRAMVTAMLAAAICLAAYPVIELDKLLRQPIKDSYELVETIPLDASYSSVCLSAPSRTSVGYPMYARANSEVEMRTGRHDIAIYSSNGTPSGTIPYPENKRSWSYLGDRYAKAPWDSYSDQGIKVVISTNKQYLLWVDRSGKELGHMPRSHYYHEAQPFGNGHYWLIDEAGSIIDEVEEDSDIGIDPPANGFLLESYFPSHHGCIITDERGNKLLERELWNVISFFKPSPTGNVMWIQAGNDNMFLNLNNRVVYSFPGYSVCAPVAFSPSGDVAIFGRPLGLVIDLTTGETLAEIKGIWSDRESSLAIADRDAGIVAFFSGSLSVYVLDYIHGEILKKFEPQRGGYNFQFSGNGKEYCTVHGVDSPSYEKFEMEEQ